MADDSNKKKKKSQKHLLGINIVGKLIGFLVIIWLISASYYAFGFFLLAMLPAITAMIVDRGAGRFASKTVSACNFIGVMPYLFEIAANYERTLAAKEIMAQPIVWLYIYGAAAMGWILIWILPQLCIITFTFRADMKVESLEKSQKNLINEWGEEVIDGKRKLLTTKNKG